MPPPRPDPPPRDAGSSPAGADTLVGKVYVELRALAAYHMAHERPGHTLQPTALVHEVYLRMAAQRTGWQSRSHFMRLAAQQIRRVLVDHARARNSQKRGGDRMRVTLSDLDSGERDFDLLALDRAMERLAGRAPEAARVVELRYFAGFTEREIADALSTSVRTVRRHWAFARAWLFRELDEENAAG